MSMLSLLEWLFGWIYFILWSATFWPQILLIFRRRTTAGLSPDFVAINIIGFYSYAIFTCISYAIPAVAPSYIKHTGFPPQVTIADVLFATHGSILCTVIVVQLILFPPRIAPKCYVTVATVFAQCAVLMGMALAAMGWLDWYRYLTVAGLVKVGSAIIKHFPQVLLNRARGSTVGWSFSMVLLDVVGGVFSISQQVVRTIMLRSMAPFSSNLAKTFLAVETMLFDFYFIAQHLIWYTDRTDCDSIEKNDRGDVIKPLLAAR